MTPASTTSLPLQGAVFGPKSWSDLGTAVVDHRLVAGSYSPASGPHADGLFPCDEPWQEDLRSVTKNWLPVHTLVANPSFTPAGAGAIWCHLPVAGSKAAPSGDGRPLTGPPSASSSFPAQATMAGWVVCNGADGNSDQRNPGICAPVGREGAGG